MTTFATRAQTVKAWGGRFDLRFQVAGSGPALVYLHPAGGLFWDDLLRDLSDRFTVYAPMFPGTDPADTMSIHQVDDIFDVVLAYEGALRSLGLQGAPAIGPSFGGMLAAELAASFPDLFSRVVLLDAAGLWSESAAWGLDFMSAPRESIPGLLFKHPEAPGPQKMFAPPSPEQALDVAVNTIWSLGCVSKFLWPVPDRGLSKRLHRVVAPTLVIWGEDDALIPVHYAHRYGRLIPHSRVEIIPDCGHVPQVEKPDATAALVKEFLGG
jgi:pimeloyl-ACP methyl ester carboxylesterase